MGDLDYAPRVLGRLVLAVSLLACLSCEDADVDCTCRVELADERRTLACGESACIAETQVTCTEDGTSVPGGVCAKDPDPAPSALPPDPGPAPTPDTRCEDLLRFCETSCPSPAATALECRSAALSGAPEACAAWSLGSGVLCHP